MVAISELNTRKKPNWCPGCGDYSILTALKTAIAELGINPKDICLTSGIGCGSKLPHWINTYGIHTIHGRSLPVATGIHLANSKLKVISVGGDGDGYGIGLSHFIHTCRRNIDTVYLVQNNQIYGLTKGQVSPTSDKESKTVSTPFGVIEWPICPLSLALVSGATFVARGFAGDIKHLTWLIKEALNHSGFGFIDILQPCVSFNKHNTYQWFQERVYKLEDKKHDTSNLNKALEKAWEWQNENDKIPIGLFYRDEKKEHYLDRYEYIKDSSLAEKDISNIDIGKIMEDFQ
ncbi:MAG: thiamine pyrophosphate-dependent enzyme [Nanoarchaeota archaeon]|nr:thiamine pyrophosphate-dependent enzyme [Nanoarchaeota archaeon]